MIKLQHSTYVDPRRVAAMQITPERMTLGKAQFIIVLENAPTITLHADSDEKAFEAMESAATAINLALHLERTQ